MAGGAAFFVQPDANKQARASPPAIICLGHLGENMRQSTPSCLTEEFQAGPLTIAATPYMVEERQKRPYQRSEREYSRANLLPQFNYCKM
jgi:hypothetical protein